MQEHNHVKEAVTKQDMPTALPAYSPSSCDLGRGLSVILVAGRRSTPTAELNHGLARTETIQ
jgi:hypothetical protein